MTQAANASLSPIVRGCSCVVMRPHPSNRFTLFYMRPGEWTPNRALAHRFTEYEARTAVDDIRRAWRGLGIEAKRIRLRIGREHS